MTLKQLSSVMILNVNGGDRISYTYDEINDESGELINGNIKETFFAIDKDLHDEIEKVRDYIRANKLA